MTVAFSGAMSLLNQSARAAFTGNDQYWDNGTSNGLWSTTDANWYGSAWDNTLNSGAFFANTPATITVAEPINLSTIDFNSSGYVINGTSPLNMVATLNYSTLANSSYGAYVTPVPVAGLINVSASSTQLPSGAIVTTPYLAQINAPINSTTGLQKVGAGTLTLGATNNITAGSTFLLTSDGRFQADVVVGGPDQNNYTQGGTLSVTSASTLPATTRLGIGNGFFNIGANNVTVASVTFPNDNGGTWNNTLNASNGVVGTGTLRVTGEINVLGQTNAGSTNAIGANLDLGGGTQIVRIGHSFQSSLNNALILSGTLSDGSLLVRLRWKRQLRQRSRWCDPHGQ
jgi:fibronectin-binding autotransporter adhesin